MRRTWQREVAISSLAVRTLFVDPMFLKPIPTHVFQVCLSDLFLAIHTSRALTGSPLAVPSCGPRGIPSLVAEITLECRCNYRDCREMAVDERGNQIAADSCGMPWKLLWQLPWTSVAIAAYRRITAGGRGNCCGLTSARIAVAIAADFRGNCHVSEECRDNCCGWP